MFAAPVGAAGFQRDRAFDRRSDDRDAGVAGRVAIAIAGRTGRAGLAEAPDRAVPLAHAPRDQQRIGFGRRPQAGHLGVADAEQRRACGLACRPPRRRESRRTRRAREQSRRDQPAGRGLRQRRWSRWRSIRRAAIFSASGSSDCIQASSIARAGTARGTRRPRRPEIFRRTAAPSFSASAWRSVSTIRQALIFLSPPRSFSSIDTGWPAGIDRGPDLAGGDGGVAHQCVRQPGQPADVRRVVEAHRDGIGAAKAADAAACGGTPCGSC